MFKITIEGQPIPHQRHRTIKGRVYYNKKYEEYRQSLIEHIWAKSRAYAKRLPLTGDLKILCIFSREGKIRGDGDNFEKPVWDALQKAGVILNDNQFTDHQTKIYYNMAKPYTEINIWNKN